MRISRPIAVTTLAGTALLGGIGGAALIDPSGAEAPSASGAAEAAPCRGGLDDLAEAIGITPEDLRAALRDGQTLAEIAEANDADPQQVVDVIVVKGTERIDAALAAGRIDQATADERKAKLAEHATKLVNGEIERDARRHPHRGPRRHPAHALLDTAAEAIGIEVADLRAAVRDGQTIAEVAEANGVDSQDVVDALAARATERFTKLVNGDILDRTC